jgi:hypothetical protein
VKAVRPIHSVADGEQDEENCSASILGHRLMRTESMNPPEKEKSGTENEGDIREERDPKPIPASQDVDEEEAAQDKEGNLPPAMPPVV